MLTQSKNFHNALIGVFPDFGMHFSPLSSVVILFLSGKIPKFNKKHTNSYNYWRSETNRRKFFTEFASKKKFDPLVPSNWNKIKYKDITAQVKGRSYHFIFKYSIGRIFYSKIS